VERRYTPRQTRVEARADGAKQIKGYAAVYYDPKDAGTEYRIWDDFVERIMPGAFDAAIEDGHDVRGLFNHDATLVLGRSEAGTLRLESDSTGLRYLIDPPNTQAGRDVVELLERGDVSGSSFAFVPTKVSWEEQRDQATNKTTYIRKIESVQLLDVGPVTYPAYQSTTAGVRSESEAKDAMQGLREFQNREREVRVRLRILDLDDQSFSA
jgi:HK97 family phage prohead protease